MKLKYAVLVLVTSLVVLTLCLRGAVPEKTYIYSEIPASAVHASIVSYDLWNGARWSVDDFAVDIDNWGKYDQNVNSSLNVNDGALNLTATTPFSLVTDSPLVKSTVS